MLGLHLVAEHAERDEDEVDVVAVLEGAGERLLVPAVRRVLDAAGRLRVLQAGRIQLYLAYVLATLLVLLVWQVAAVAP